MTGKGASTINSAGFRQKAQMLIFPSVQGDVEESSRIDGRVVRVADAKDCGGIAGRYYDVDVDVWENHPHLNIVRLKKRRKT